jgi:putative transcriptional regulator
MYKTDLTSRVLEIMSASGYVTVDCRGSRSSFDVICKKGGNIIIIKTLSNVEALSSECARELKSLSALLEAAPLVVGERMKNSGLSDDIVYDRHGVHVINPHTLEDLVNDDLPCVYSKRGNYCVKINPNSLAQARVNAGFTQNSLAKILGVTKQSVYRYENTGTVNIDIFEKLMGLFGSDIMQPALTLNFEQPQLGENTSSKATEFKRQIMEEFNAIGFHTTLTNAPFDIVAKNRERVFSVVSNDCRRLNEKLEILEEISDITGGYTLCVSRRRVRSNVFSISPKELSQIKTPFELFKFLSDNNK